MPKAAVISKTKKCPTCGITRSKYLRGKTNKDGWSRHLKTCPVFHEKYGRECACGKTIKDFNGNIGFSSHVTRCAVAKKAKKAKKANPVSKLKSQASKPQKDHEANKLVEMSVEDIREYAKKLGYDMEKNVKKEPLLRVLFSDHFELPEGATESILSRNPDRKDPVKKRPAAIKTKSVAVKKEFECHKCGKSFATKNQVVSHSWIHRKPEKGKEWGDKDAIRTSLQTIAAARLQRLPLAKRVAICLPGNRPGHEKELLADPGFSRIHMVECIEDKFLAAQKKGFNVTHGDFLEVMMDLVNQGTRLALIDYDLCGTLSYADGSTILEAIRAGGLADIAAVRVTCCRRNYKRSGELDIAALDRDIFGALPPGYGVTGKSWNFYVGKDRSSMATQQWLIEKGA